MELQFPHFQLVLDSYPASIHFAALRHTLPALADLEQCHRYNIRPTCPFKCRDLLIDCGIEVNTRHFLKSLLTPYECQIGLTKFSTSEYARRIICVSETRVTGLCQHRQTHTISIHILPFSGMAPTRVILALLAQIQEHIPCHPYENTMAICRVATSEPFREPTALSLTLAFSNKYEVHIHTKYHGSFTDGSTTSVRLLMAPVDGYIASAVSP